MLADSVFAHVNIQWSARFSSTEIWEHLLRKSTSEGAQTFVSEGIDEAQLSLVKVKMQSDDIRPLILINIKGRLITFSVCTIYVTETPKTTLRIHFKKSFSVHCCPHHTQCPVVVVSHLYIPAVQTWAEALWGQNSHIKPLWILRHTQLAFHILDTGAILWYQQLFRGRVWVQSHRCCIHRWAIGRSFTWSWRLIGAKINWS